jgi:SnoaL-like protein
VTVSEHRDPRITRVVRLLDAYRVGNMQSMQHHMTFDVALEAVGDNPLAGTYKGVGGVLAFIGRSTSTFVTESVKIENVSLEGEEVHVVVIGDIRLAEGGTETVRILQRYRFDGDGMVTRIRAEAADDQDEFDRLVTQARLP